MTNPVSASTVATTKEINATGVKPLNHLGYPISSNDPAAFGDPL